MREISEKKLLWGLFFSALLLRLLFVIILPLDAGDSPEYDNYALRLLSGLGFSTNLNRPPLYPSFLAGIYFFFGHSFPAVRIIQALLDSVTCLFAFFIGKRVFGDKKPALLGGLLTAVSPSLIASTSYILTETLTAFLLTAAVLLLLKAQAESKKEGWLLSGVVLGLATLTRPVTILFPFFLLTGFLFFSPRKARNVFLVIVFCLGMALPILPWTIRNALVFHRFIPVSVGSGFNLWVGSYLPWNGDYNWKDLSDSEELVKGLPQIEADRKFFAEGVKNIKQRPAAYALLCVKKIGRFWLQVPGGKQVLDKRPAAKILVFTFQYLLLLLFLSGVFSAWRERNVRVCLPVLMIFYFTFVHLFLLAIPRYHIPVLPLAAAIAGGSLKILRLRKNENFRYYPGSQ
ncbi:MAG: glycosyltransferase family 39 protein [Candidatus Omnitrophica bacterium]|nr:glycosyltransferase family 39 protein [Candidatus Omnitrophota bacterium]